MRGVLACVVATLGCGRLGFAAQQSDNAPDAGVVSVSTDATGTIDDATPSDCQSCAPSLIAFVAATSGANDGANVSFAHTVDPGSRRLLLVGAHVASKAYTTASVTYAGIPLAQVDTSIKANTIAEDCSSTLWYLVDPPTGTGNVVANLEASTRPMAAWAMSFTGVDASAPVAASNWITGSTLAKSASVSIASMAGELVVDNYCMAITPPATLSAGTNQLERVRQDVTSNEMRIAGSTMPGGPSPGVAWAFGDAYYTLRAVVLRPATN
jgi:hypothetical protein